MKRKTSMNRFLLSLAALLIPPFTFANPDTLFVNHGATTYLLFSEDVKLVDIGKAGEYLSRIEGKCVFVKAAKQGATPTSILVQYGEEFFVALLAYEPLVKTFLYDCRRKTVKEVLPKGSSEAQILDIEGVRPHFNAFQNLPQGVKSKTVQRHHLRLSLTHLQNDKKATFLSFTLENNSSIDYQIELVTFERQEKKGRRFSQNNINNAFIKPLFASDTELIEAGKKGQLFYALPLYALGARSYIKLSLREKNGSRMLTLKLPARYINKATIYQP